MMYLEPLYAYLIGAGPIGSLVTSPVVTTSNNNLLWQVPINNTAIVSNGMLKWQFKYNLSYNTAL